MKQIDGISYAEHGDVVEMEVHRGGGYTRDSSIHEGGDWTRKQGVVVVKQAAFQVGNETLGNPEGVVTRTDSEGRVWATPAWIYFFDGDMQATDTRMDRRGFPNGPMIYVRAATDDELRTAEAPYGFRGRPYPLKPLP